MKAPAFRIAIVLALASLSIVGRVAMVWLPNVSLSYLALAVAGLAYGIRAGAAVGLLGRLGSDLIISGLNPILLPMGFVETLIGVAFGILGHLVDVPRFFSRMSVWTRILLFDLGLVVTLAYSVLADSVTWVFYNLILRDAPDAARGTLWTTLVVLGLAFSAIPAVIHGVLFASALPPILRGLEASSLLPERPMIRPENSVETTALLRGPQGALSRIK